jgi:hypothetical protein
MRNSQALTPTGLPDCITGVKKRGDAPYRFQGNEEDRLLEHFNLVGQ